MDDLIQTLDRNQANWRPAISLPIAGRRIQIAGSASGTTDPALVRYAHEIIARLVTKIMTAGGGIVISAGRKPRPDGAAVDAPIRLMTRL